MKPARGTSKRLQQQWLHGHLQDPGIIVARTLAEKAYYVKALWMMVIPTQPGFVAALSESTSEYVLTAGQVISCSSAVCTCDHPSQYFMYSTREMKAGHCRPSPAFSERVPINTQGAISCTPLHQIGLNLAFSSEADVRSYQSMCSNPHKLLASQIEQD
jgi:hypothetical protein